MKYFKINRATDRSAIGSYPQSREMSPDYQYDGDLSVVNIDYAERINFNPDFKSILLHKKVKVTDLLSTVTISNRALVISDLLFKIIMSVKSTNDKQHFRVDVVDQDSNHFNYNFFYIHDLGYNFFDFKNMSLLRTSMFDYKDQEEVRFNNTEEFLQSESENKLKKQFYSYSADEVKLIEDKIDVDIFRLESICDGYYVSEKLRNLIEDASCTGIQFAPIG